MDVLLDILSPINIIFAAVIIYLTYEDFKSFLSGSYRNYKSLIISIGLLGTFVGIFWGLLNFDSKDLASIQASIPNLLSGLRTAFVTSIMGMIAALTLTFAQKKFFDTSFSEDSSEILRSIEIKLSKLDNLQNIYDVNLEFLQEISSVKDEFSEVNQQMVAKLIENFDKTNETLERAIEKLSSDSSKEIVSSLEGVIGKFNESMTDQFGQNFKEFNDALGRLLEWQNQYKDTLEQMNNNIETSVKSLQASDEALGAISSKNEQIIKIYELFGKMTDKYEDQAFQINTKILAQVELLEVIQNVFDDTKYKFGQFVEEFSDGSTQVLGGFIETKESLDQISNKINISLSKQAETMRELSSRLEQELPNSLSQLDNTLKSLTEGFKDDYQTFLEYYKNLVLSKE